MVIRQWASYHMAGDLSKLANTHDAHSIIVNTPNSQYSLATKHAMFQLNLISYTTRKIPNKDGISDGIRFISDGIFTSMTKLATDYGCRIFVCR